MKDWEGKKIGDATIHCCVVQGVRGGSIPNGLIL